MKRHGQNYSDCIPKKWKDKLECVPNSGEEASAAVRPQAEAVRAASWEEASIASVRRVAVIHE
jgi:hypothetical protein